MLGEAMSPDLEAADFGSERPALMTVFDRIPDAFIHRGESAERGGEPFALKVFHDVVEAAIHLAEDIAGGDPAFVKEQLGRIGGKIADLLELLSYGEAFRPGRKQYERDPFVSFRAG